ncbi:hypothetical protein ZIOFF_034648 [Zingiber officinale]|uniref:Histone H2A n=1 Tax=Zingiber officinale TaxID=94328 RepID=A0A8J5L922_ZINOF|nr:hypothetical protein ZIOFF_034648 [Zingiber officinale]
MVENLKKAIAAVGEEKMPLEQHVLLVLSNGRLLADDGSALAKASVRDDSVIYLFFTSIGDPNWLPFLDYHFLKAGKYAELGGAGTPVYLPAVLEYLAAEVCVLELAGSAARDNEKTRIVPPHIQLTVRNDAMS